MSCGILDMEIGGLISMFNKKIQKQALYFKDFINLEDWKDKIRFKSGKSAFDQTEPQKKPKEIFLVC